MRINRIDERMDENSALNHQNGGSGQLGGMGVGGAGSGVQAGGSVGGLGGMLNNNNSMGGMNNNKPGGGGMGGPGGVGGGQDDQNNKSSPTQYSIPGILHFIQHEWARFELERSQWDVDRAELQVSDLSTIFLLIITSVRCFSNDTFIVLFIICKSMPKLCQQMVERTI